MQYSKLFTQTRREAPADIELPGQQMLVRAGYIQPLRSDGPLLLPLGQLVMRRLETRLAGALAEMGGLEIGTGAARAGGIPSWVETARAHLRSHRQLPAIFYHFDWQPAAEPRHAAGLLGARLNRVLEVHLLSADSQRQEHMAAEMAGLLLGLLRDLRLPLWGGEYLPGAGVQAGQVWLYPHLAGGERLLQCGECGYSAEPSAARFRRPTPSPEMPLPLQPVATPETKTIAALAGLLGIPEARTAKAVFLTAEDAGMIFAVVRGDREVNEAALRRLVGSDQLRPASEEEIRAAGAVPGYASPVGLRGVRVVVDTQVPLSPNLVAGANREGYHLLNVNYGRDYTASDVAEIALARAGDACPECGEPLEEIHGVQLADARRWSAESISGLGISFIDENGKGCPPQVETYRLQLTRAFGCLAEEHMDDRGLRMPVSAAPYAVHLVVLAGKNPAVEETATQAAALLADAGFEALIDDRSDSPGVKFNDADLIGLPLRLTVSERALKEGGVEMKRRGDPDKWLVPLEELIEQVRRVLDEDGPG